MQSAFECRERRAGAGAGSIETMQGRPDSWAVQGSRNLPTVSLALAFDASQRQDSDKTATGLRMTVFALAATRQPRLTVERLVEWRIEYAVNDATGSPREAGDPVFRHE